MGKHKILLVPVEAGNYEEEDVQTVLDLAVGMYAVPIDKAILFNCYDLVNCIAKHLGLQGIQVQMIDPPKNVEDHLADCGSLFEEVCTEWVMDAQGYFSS